MNYLYAALFSQLAVVTLYIYFHSEPGVVHFCMSLAYACSFAVFLYLLVEAVLDSVYKRKKKESEGSKNDGRK